MIKEFTNLNGGIKKLSEKIDRGLLNDMCRPEKYVLTIFYRPARELMYKGKKAIYQICEFRDTNRPFVIVHGYKRSEAYLKEEGLAVEVEPVEEKEKKDLERVLKKVTNADWPINFW